jgi:hypothetical protein
MARDDSYIGLASVGSTCRSFAVPARVVWGVAGFEVCAVGGKLFG